ncbi:MAG: hypothetical protein ISQ86_01360, partial [Alphaproteobacteria bacterium]|nr:hypothetical protein [Alphaproteobacteria bacterium]
MRRALLIAFVFVLLAAAVFGVWWKFFRAPVTGVEEGPLRLIATGFEDVPGWKDADLSAALSAFRRSCVKILGLPSNAPMAYAGTAD